MLDKKKSLRKIVFSKLKLQYKDISNVIRDSNYYTSTKNNTNTKKTYTKRNNI